MGFFGNQNFGNQERRPLFRHVVVSSRVHSERSLVAIPACASAGNWQSVSGGRRDNRSISESASASNASAVYWKSSFGRNPIKDSSSLLSAPLVAILLPELVESRNRDEGISFENIKS